MLTLELRGKELEEGVLLDELLQRHFEEETLGGNLDEGEGWMCSGCQMRVHATKRMQLSVAPQFLLLRSQRQDPNASTLPHDRARPRGLHGRQMPK
jgi:ubiquitin C-terminal hydrolase